MFQLVLERSDGSGGFQSVPECSRWFHSTPGAAQEEPNPEQIPHLRLILTEKGVWDGVADFSIFLTLQTCFNWQEIQLIYHQLEVPWSLVGNLPDLNATQEFFTSFSALSLWER